LTVTDRAYILKSGKIFRKGRPEDLSNDPEVRRVVFGRPFPLELKYLRAATEGQFSQHGLARAQTQPKGGAEADPGRLAWCKMVSVLALNRLELKEMINTEMVANPVLEELSEEATTTDNYSDETFLKNETEKSTRKASRKIL